MVDKIFDNETLISLKKALDAASLRQKVIANNIANVDTPGFKRADVAFEDELRAALEVQEKLEMQTPHPKHISNKRKNLEDVNPRVITQSDTTYRNDLNNVDIEQEMAKLTENNIIYNTIAQLISEKLRMLRTTIQEGRR
jgi:flagellar basal-body rod protein FlgB